MFCVQGDNIWMFCVQGGNIWIFKSLEKCWEFYGIVKTVADKNS